MRLLAASEFVPLKNPEPLPQNYIHITTSTNRGNKLDSLLDFWYKDLVDYQETGVTSMELLPGVNG